MTYYWPDKLKRAILSKLTSLYEAMALVIFKISSINYTTGRDRRRGRLLLFSRELLGWKFG